MSNAVSLSKPYVRPSIADDCLELARTMRVEDVTEVAYACGKCPLQTLKDSMEASPLCWTVMWQGRIVAMFGCAGSSGAFGYPWMLATDDLTRIRKSFLREARVYLHLMECRYSYLTNFAWSKNTTHLNWLRWMGFHLDEERPVTIRGESFILFHKGTHV